MLMDGAGLYMRSYDLYSRMLLSLVLIAPVTRMYKQRLPQSLTPSVSDADRYCYRVASSGDNHAAVATTTVYYQNAGSLDHGSATTETSFFCADRPTRLLGVTV